MLINIAQAQTFGTAVNVITNNLRLVVPILFLVATIVFLWGVIIYITAGGDEKKIKTGHQYIIWGLVGLFVMVAVWGLVRLLVSFIFGTTALPPSPQLPDLPGIRGIISP